MNITQIESFINLLKQTQIPPYNWSILTSLLSMCFYQIHVIVGLDPTIAAF